MAEILGDDFNLFYDTSGNFTSPTWVVQASIGDLSLDTAKEQVEIPLRIAYKVYKTGRGDWTLSFTMNYDKANTFHMAVLAAIRAGSRIHLAFVDGSAISGNNYYHAWWVLTGPINAALDSPGTVEVEGKIHHDRGGSGTELPAYVAAA